MKDAQGRSLFDGYLNVVGVPFERELRQGISPYRFSLKPRRRLTSSVPLVMVSSEGDIALFSGRMAGVLAELPEDSDVPGNLCRYYEVAGAPHTDIDCGILSSDAEILRAGRTPLPMDPALRSQINDFPLAEYICGFLEKMYIWRTAGVAPAVSPRFKRDETGALCRDAHGNVRGGFRSPYVDLPVARYQGSGDIPSGDIGGCRTELAEDGEVVERRISRLEAGLRAQREAGWLVQGAVKRMLAAERARHLRSCGGGEDAPGQRAH